MICPPIKEFMIRPADIKDIPVLESIEKDSFKDNFWDAQSFEEEIKTKGNHFWVQDCAGFILGYISIESFKDRIYISSLAVMPRWRNQGLAEELIRHVELFTMRHKKNKVDLHVAVENTGAVALYSKLHYQVDAYQYDFYSEGKDALRMSKRILP